MAKYVYPAVFTPEDGGYVVAFPDFGGATQGEDVVDAIDMAADFLGFACWNAEHDHAELKKPTPLEEVAVPKNGFVNLVTADTEAYQKIIDRENNPIKYAREQGTCRTSRCPLSHSTGLECWSQDAAEMDAGTHRGEN